LFFAQKPQPSQHPSLLSLSLYFSTYGVFGYEILKIKYNYDSTFFKNKSYFIQLFSKKSNLKIRKQNKNLIPISKIQHSNAPSVSLSIFAIILQLYSHHSLSVS
jgi:hypothetical protein